MEQIFGTVERITFCSEESGFSVVRVKQPRKGELTTVVGVLPPVKPGEQVRCVGEWKRDPTYGMQFATHECHIELPNDVVGIEKYLASGLVKGIGPTYAKKIVKRFKEKTLEVIEKTPHRLLEVAGIGKKRVETIGKYWGDQQAIRDVMVFLQKYGVSPAYAQKIYKVYGNEAVERVQEDPYILAEHIPGIGFKMADKIAEQMGFPKESAQRTDAGILYLLGECASEGHVCFPKEELIAQAQEFGLSHIEARLGVLTLEERLFEEDGFLYLKPLYLCELGIARECERLLNGTCALRAVDAEKAVDWAQSQLSIELAPNQREAVKQSLTSKFHIITGGPGTGKSTITKAILAITSKLTGRILLAAPTGRAAKRMTEITRRDASTIHSLLQYDFQAGGFKRNRTNPLDCALLIVDEASMIDTTLMYQLLRAVPTDARVLLVGDIHQLPSVGPGNVLKDLIESGALPVTELTEIFRQAAGSKIITNAHKINAGTFPDLTPSKGSDFFFLKADDPEQITTKILDLVSTRLPRSYNLDPIEHIQVLAPMKRGPIGIEALNHLLQNRLNPQTDGVTHNGTRYSPADKVMQIRNNYQKEISNGDIGRISHIDHDSQELTVLFDSRPVTYTFQELDELTLAYATSIHKYQGSETPCVIIPVHTSHFKMLHRNLLYTGVTRGKRLVVLVGTGKAIGIAVSTDDTTKRHTRLASRLQKQT